MTPRAGWYWVRIGDREAIRYIDPLVQIDPDDPIDEVLERVERRGAVHFVDDAAAPQPSAWIPERDPVRLAKLGKCVEEMGECVAALGRCICQGIDECDPDTGESNAMHLHDELADVRASELLVLEEVRNSALRTRCDERDLDDHYLRRVERKLVHKRGWHRKLREIFDPSSRNPSGERL